MLSLAWTASQCIDCFFGISSLLNSRSVSLLAVDVTIYSYWDRLEPIYAFKQKTWYYNIN